MKKPVLKKGAHWIDRDLITSPYCIGLCQTEKQFYKELKRLNVPISECPEWIPEGKEGAVWHFSEEEGIGKCCLVCIRKRKGVTPLAVVGLLIHESVHVWQKIKTDICEHNPSAEFEAYSIQSISQRLIEAYKQ